MERMREVKLAKSDASASSTAPPEPTTSEAPDESSGTTSQSLEGTTTEHEEAESAEESLNVPVTAQLPNDHDSSDSSDDGFTGDDERQACLKQQPKHNLKMMAVVLFMNSLMDRFNMTTVDAAKEVGLLLDHNEKTICTWRQDFYNNHGQFTESRQGKHTRQFILDDEKLQRKAAQWVRANSTVKGRTGAKFCTYVNTHLLPEAELAPGCPQQIQPCTAIKWLHHLGFQPQSHKKSIYIDGHERDDEVEYRKLYLRKLEILSSTHLPPPACEDGLTAIQTGNPSAATHLVLIFHDESSFHANEGQSVMWDEEGRVPIRPKSQGRGLMVSDFVTEFDGLLQLSMEEYRRAAEADPSIRECVRKEDHQVWSCQ